MKNGQRLQQPPGWGSNGSECGTEQSYETGSSASQSKTRYVDGDRKPSAPRRDAREASSDRCASNSDREENSARSWCIPCRPISNPRPVSSRTNPGPTSYQPPRLNEERYPQASSRSASSMANGRPSADSTS